MARSNATRQRLLLLIVASFAFLTATTYANTPSAFPRDFTPHTWTKQQGLPDDSVTCILQTRDGYLWVGTPAGLARFDGMKFVVMAGAVSVTALCEDSAGRLWIGTQSAGLFRYDNGVLSQFSEDRTFHFQTINSIAEDGNGALWVGTPNGLIRLDHGQLSRFTTTNGLPNDFILNVHVARSGTLWVTTRDGMCQFTNGQIAVVPFRTEGPGRYPVSLGVYEDRRGQHWAYGDTYLVNLEDGKHLNRFGSGDAASTRIWSLCEGKNGELWIGASGKGLYCFTGEKFQTPTLHGGELTSDVRAICQDRQGNLWLGTHGDGLVRLQPYTARLLDAGTGLPSRPAVCLAFTPEEKVWIAMDRAGLYTGAGSTFEHLPNETEPALQNLVSSVCVTPDSSIWIGTPGAGLYCLQKQRCLHLTTADGLSDNHILSLAVDSDHAIWVGTAVGLHRITNGVVTGFAATDGLPEVAVTAILSDHGEGVWIGLNDGSVFHEARGQFQRISNTSNASGKPIRALCEDAANRLWIGTENGRVGCIVGNRFYGWDFVSGTADKSVLGIVTSDDGDLWIETDRSVYCVAQKFIEAWLSGQPLPRPQFIFRTDAVSGNGPAYGWPRAMKTSDGNLWFAMDSGLVAIDLAGTSTDTSLPPVVIEDVVLNKDQPGPRPFTRDHSAASAVVLPHALFREATAGAKGQSLRLPSSLRSLDIDFTALDLSSPEKIRFRHRLDGFELDWVVDNEMTRNVHYGKLPYGTYTFRVQAGGPDQRWFDNEASFRFLIPTPAWRSRWALVTYSLAALALVGGVARLVSARRFRLRLAALSAQQAMERERMRIARDMHDEIGSKLTKISFMSERAKRELQGQEPVAKKLDSIAGTSRDLLQTLDEIVWAVNPHNDTLEHLAAYLGQYATEYLQNTAVECELHIPRGLPHHPLSAEARHNLFLAFEESLNNALKHGRPTRVCVDMQITPSQFEIRIEDNGCGFDSALLDGRPAQNGTAGRNGLQNMRQRLELLGGHCNILSRAGQGTTVSLTLPLTLETATKPNAN